MLERYHSVNSVCALLTVVPGARAAGLLEK